MGFVGGGGNTAISTALPQPFCVLYCKHLLVIGIHISYFFYACLRLRFRDVETNPGPRRPVPTVCRLLCSNVWGLAPHMVSEFTLVSNMSHVSELLVPGFGRPVFLCRGRMPRVRGMDIRTRWIWSISPIHV